MHLLLLLAGLAHAQMPYITERCGVGSGVAVCDYIGDRFSQNVAVECTPKGMQVITAQFGPAGYPVQCLEFAQRTCNGHWLCTLAFSNARCEASGVLPASIKEQVVFVSCLH